MGPEGTPWLLRWTPDRSMRATPNRRHGQQQGAVSLVCDAQAALEALLEAALQAGVAEGQVPLHSSPEQVSTYKHACCCLPDLSSDTTYIACLPDLSTSDSGITPWEAQHPWLAT